METVIDRAFRKRRAESDVTLFIHRTAKFKFAQRPLQLGIKVRKSLRIIPHMRARTVTATSVRKTSLPSPQVAIFQAQHGRRLEDCQICGDRHPAHRVATWKQTTLL